MSIILLIMIVLAESIRMARTISSIPGLYRLTTVGARFGYPSIFVRVPKVTIKVSTRIADQPPIKTQVRPKTLSVKEKSIIALLISRKSRK